ncbi:MAG: hypothetical protein B7Z68_00395 [Acidobacteria bacterium 21-70-11]|nr:MAG: hypothetical protein B7Z68_00395 [Acidobacteria bacterium 21-70-11]
MEVERLNGGPMTLEDWIPAAMEMIRQRGYRPDQFEEALRHIEQRMIARDNFLGVSAVRCLLRTRPWERHQM